MISLFHLHTIYVNINQWINFSFGHAVSHKINEDVVKTCAIWWKSESGRDVALKRRCAPSERCDNILYWLWKQEKTTTRAIKIHDHHLFGRNITAQKYLPIQSDGRWPYSKTCREQKRKYINCKWILCEFLNISIK